MSETAQLPIFPLNAVLFPQGRLSLQIFEARYLDMIARCMQATANFGICLIAQGQEVGGKAEPHPVGVEARITDWDMSVPNILGLTVRGERRFRILEQSTDAAGVITATVEWFAEPAAAPVSAAHQALLPLLAVIIADTSKQVVPLPHHLDDAAWVGHRYSEVLPIPTLARQRLLELEDADMRLAIIHEYLAARGLVKPQPKA